VAIISRRVKLILITVTEMNAHWLKSSLDPKDIKGKKVFVIDRTTECTIEARLHVDQVHKNGQMLVSAEFNSSPHSNTVSIATFQLTQAQLDSFAQDGEKCILEIPAKSN
jgi:hypothetical protein